MDDLSLYLQDLIQNSIAANSTVIYCEIEEKELLHISIKDNGCGMANEQLKNAISPFYTTRKTRKIGLGLSMIKMLTEQTEGFFDIQSIPNKGTTLRLGFDQNHIDMPPLGNLGEMVYMISIHQNVNEFIFTYSKYNQKYQYRLSEFKNLLGVTITQYSIMNEMIRLINQEIETIRGVQ
ncbi:MAG: sensor histidine kinase [Acholeplasmataceae bacterium]|nr:sensor histidine kinase [Acholeplasmataceae bacterium]